MGANVDAVSEMPEDLAYLWSHYIEMRFSRVADNNGFSMMPRKTLDIALIDYHQKAFGLNLNNREIKTILSLDATFEKNRG